MKKIISLIIAIFFMVYNSAGAIRPSAKDFSQYVNPLIGTANTTTIEGLRHGGEAEHRAMVQPSVTMPFGMTNWTPQTRSSEKKCEAAYFYEDNIITGFRGSHWLSGSCTQDYGSFAIMPVFGKLICDPAKRGSEFSHDHEISQPNYYRVYLENYDLTTEMTATTRCGLFRFTFNKGGDAHLVINPNSDENEGYIKVLPETNEIVGYNPIHRIYQGWGKPAGFSGYFVMKVGKAPIAHGVYFNGEINPDQLSVKAQKDLGAYFSFKVKQGEKIIVKIGTSFVSTEQARKNLEAEIPLYNFDEVRSNLNSDWNKLLSKIEVEGDIYEDKVKFYTAMYHCFQQPRIYDDVDGQYPRFDGNSQTDTICSGNYYCDFSAWDTYRALHALYNLIAPEKSRDMIRSLLIMAKAGGWMPIYPAWNSYTSEMIGDHATSIIAEAYIKGVIDLTEEDYQVLRRNATVLPDSYEQYAEGKGRRALTSYLKYGYIPLEDSVKEAFHKGEQVSRTLEYAYDDFALAQIAEKMGKSDDYKYFMKRAQNYRNVFDPERKNMNGRYADGEFSKSFIRDKWMPFITEGTPWQYNWYVPHDILGLIGLMGGKEKFNADLDAFFKAGQYWHGNEPSHQTPYLYIFSGQAWKTQKIVMNTMHEEYGVGPGGLSGNDDAGQMSAWYIFGAMGFYPVCPSMPEYPVCGSKFKKIILNLPSGKELVIKALNYSSNNFFIQKITLNGVTKKSFSFNHNELEKGGKIIFKVSNTPHI